jgi:hypothetical protein
LGEGPFPPLIAEVVSTSRAIVEIARDRLAPVIAPSCEIQFRFSESSGFCPTLHAPTETSHVIYIPLGFVVRLIGFVGSILRYENDGPTIRLLMSPINRPEQENIKLPASLSCLISESANDWKSIWAETEQLLSREESTLPIAVRPLADVYMDTLLLCSLGCTFAIFHEMAHAFEYHIRAKRWVQQNIDPSDEAIELFYKGIEARADTAATTYSLAFLSGLKGFQSREQNRNFVIAVAALFSSLDINRRAYKSYDDGDYFPPIARVYNCLDAIESYVREHDLDEWREESRNALGAVISALDYVAVSHGSEYPIHSLASPIFATGPAADALGGVLRHQWNALKFAEGFLGIENRGAILRSGRP